MNEIKPTWVKINGIRLSVGSWRIDTYKDDTHELIIEDIYFKGKKAIIEFVKIIFEIIG